MFDSVVAHCRWFLNKPLVHGGEWEEEEHVLGLEMKVEGYDARNMFVYYKGSGSLLISPHELEPNTYEIYFAGGEMVEVASAPFTGAERGWSRIPPYNEEIDDLRGLFVGVRVRVVVSCPKTGKRALFYDQEACCITARPNEHDPPSWGLVLPPGCREVYTLGDRLYAPGTSCFPPTSTVDYLEASFTFFLEPTEGQNQDGYGGQWRTARTIGSHKVGCARIHVLNANRITISHFIGGLLATSP